MSVMKNGYTTFYPKTFYPTTLYLFILTAILTLTLTPTLNLTWRRNVTLKHIPISTKIKSSFVDAYSKPLSVINTFAWLNSPQVYAQTF